MDFKLFQNLNSMDSWKNMKITLSLYNYMSILTQKGNPDSLQSPSFTIMTLPYMCMESIEDLFSKKNALYKD